jgi:mRNA interferase MazF
MRRGELYRVYKASARDPRRSRLFVVVSRQTLIGSRFSTAICPPIYSAYDGLSTQVPVGVAERPQHESSIHCDELISIPQSALTDFLATLPPDKIAGLDRTLAIAVGIDAPA